MISYTNGTRIACPHCIIGTIKLMYVSSTGTGFECKQCNKSHIFYNGGSQQIFRKLKKQRQTGKVQSNAGKVTCNKCGSRFIRSIGCQNRCRGSH